MTVRELMVELGKQDPTLVVVTDQHSEYTEISTVAPIKGFNNGGYISHAYLDTDKGKVKAYLYVG